MLVVIYQYFAEKEILKVDVPNLNDPVTRTFKRSDGQIAVRKWDNFKAWENGMARVTDFKLVLE